MHISCSKDVWIFLLDIKERCCDFKRINSANRTTEHFSILQIHINDPYLKSPHVSGVPCGFQTVLIALQEKLQEKSVGNKQQPSCKPN